MAPVPQYIAELMASVARVEGKVDNFLGQMKVQDDRTTALTLTFNENAKETSRRLGKVENRLHLYAGGAGVSGGVLGAVFGGIVEFFLAHH
jgi:6-phosphogluconate dehydrogenase